jgi:hypothetical protein
MLNSRKDKKKLLKSVSGDFTTHTSEYRETLGKDTSDIKEMM